MEPRKTLTRDLGSWVSKAAERGWKLRPDDDGDDNFVWFPLSDFAWPTVLVLVIVVVGGEGELSCYSKFIAHTHTLMSVSGGRTPFNHFKPHSHAAGIPSLVAHQMAEFKPHRWCINFYQFSASAPPAPRDALLSIRACLISVAIFHAQSTEEQPRTYYPPLSSSCLAVTCRWMEQLWVPREESLLLASQLQNIWTTPSGDSWLEMVKATPHRNRGKYVANIIKEILNKYNKAT